MRDTRFVLFSSLGHDGVSRKLLSPTANDDFKYAQHRREFRFDLTSDLMVYRLAETASRRGGRGVGGGAASRRFKSPRPVACDRGGSGLGDGGMLRG